MKNKIQCYLLKLKNKNCQNIKRLPHSFIFWRSNAPLSLCLLIFLCYNFDEIFNIIFMHTCYNIYGYFKYHFYIPFILSCAKCHFNLETLIMIWNCFKIHYEVYVLLHAIQKVKDLLHSLTILRCSGRTIAFLFSNLNTKVVKYFVFSSSYFRVFVFVLSCFRRRNFVFFACWIKRLCKNAVVLWMNTVQYSCCFTPISGENVYIFTS